MTSKNGIIKRLFIRILVFILPFFFSFTTSYAQLPANVLVGYLHNWETLTMSSAHANYNVICLAFAYDPPTYSVGPNMLFTRPPGYATDAAMMADIDLMHAQGKKVLLSIGGATGWVMLNSPADQTTFETSITAIFTRFGNKIDGLDLDLETSNSMGFGATWTITAPDARQTRMVNAVKNIMATYQATNGKKMILTAAPEVVYLMGGMSAWQVANVNGGAFLPILDGLRNEIDMVFMQCYNAGGASGGVYAWDGNLYYDGGPGIINFVLAMNESLIKGFTCASGKGVWNPFPENKVAFGLLSNAHSSTGGTGWLNNTQICEAARYFKGEIAKPASITYTMNASRPGLRGLMTWSINQDLNFSTPAWNFATGYTCAFSTVIPAPVADFTFTPSPGCTGQTVTFTDASTNTPTSWAWNFGAGATPATANTKGPHNVTYSSTGTKTVTLTATNGSGSDGDSKSVTITTIPSNAGAITGTGGALCQSSSQNYSITPVAGATNYTWTVPAGTTINSGQGTVSINVTIGGTAGNIAVTPSNSCGNSTGSTLAITINPTPAQPLAITGTNSLCAGTTGVTYTIAPVGGASGYTWAVPSGASITAGAGTTSITVTFGSTSGNVTVGANNGCGTGTLQTRAITVNTTPATPGTISGTSPICPSTTNTYSIAAVAGATGYNWTLPSGWTGTSTTTSINATANSTSGTISVNATNTCGTSANNSLAITVGTGLSVSGATRCGSGIVNLQVLSGGGPFNWYAASTGGASLQTGATYSPSISSTTTFFVEETTISSGTVGMTTAPPTDLQVYNYNNSTRTFDPTLNTMNFTTSQANVTINSVDVYTGSGSQAYLSNFWVTIENASSTVLFTSPTYSIASSFPTPNPKFRTVPISLLLPAAGSYKMRIYCNAQADAWGQYASGQALPVSDVGNVVTLNSGFTGFTKVQFQYGSGGASCGRTPVIGTVNCTPNVTLVSPTTGATHALNTVMTLTSSATDDGTITSMSYVIRRTSDNAIIATVAGGAGPTYSATWTPTIDQDYTITAIGTDNGGLTGTSATAIVDVFTPLPVELINFSGKTVDNSNIISWTTASERNNSHFELERSADGASFESIGRVEGNGNSDKSKDYIFIDENPLKGNNFYRLAQYDFSNDINKSSIIVLSNITQSCSVSPNPFSNNTTIRLENIPNATVELIDIRGNTVSTYKTDHSVLEIGNDIAPGVYQVKVLSENYSFVMKIVKL